MLFDMESPQSGFCQENSISLSLFLPPQFKVTTCKAPFWGHSSEPGIPHPQARNRVGRAETVAVSGGSCRSKPPLIHQPFPHLFHAPHSLPQALSWSKVPALLGLRASPSNLWGHSGVGPWGWGRCSWLLLWWPKTPWSTEALKYWERGNKNVVASINEVRKPWASLGVSFLWWNMHIWEKNCAPNSKWFKNLFFHLEII